MTDTQAYKVAESTAKKMKTVMYVGRDLTKKPFENWVCAPKEVFLKYYPKSIIRASLGITEDGSVKRHWY